LKREFEICPEKPSAKALVLRMKWKKVRVAQRHAVCDWSLIDAEAKTPISGYPPDIVRLFSHYPEAEVGFQPTPKTARFLDLFRENDSVSSSH